MDYATACEWLRLHDVIVNRVSIINQVLGARYDGCLDNPLLIRCKRGLYTVTLCGVDYVSWRAYDITSTDDALHILDGLKRGLWLIRRSGLYDFTKCQLT